MKKVYLIIVIITSILACDKSNEHITGKYELEVKGMNNVTSGELEIVGEPEDYFGRITFNSKRKRVYELGLKYKRNDSLYFILPGKGGFLALKKINSIWSGKFKYFGIQAEIQAKKIGGSSNELNNLVDLKPIGMGIITTDQEESFPSFDNTNQVLYFTREQKIYSSKLNDSEWETPERLSFSKDFNDSAPYIFNKGQSLLFTSNRPINNGESKKKNLWIVNKINKSWRNPEPLVHPINIDTLGDYHGAAIDSSNYYFVSYNRQNGYGKSDLYLGSRNEAGKFEVRNLGEQINSEKSEADVFIDPNENYLLFASTSRIDSYGADDIYISYRDGEIWTTPQNIGAKVNSFAYEYGAWVDQLNGYFYFNSFRRGTSDIYRVKLEELEVFNEN